MPDYKKGSPSSGTSNTTNTNKDSGDVRFGRRRNGPGSNFTENAGDGGRGDGFLPRALGNEAIRNMMTGQFGPNPALMAELAHEPELRHMYPGMGPVGPMGPSYLGGYTPYGHYGPGSNSLGIPNSAFLVDQETGERTTWGEAEQTTHEDVVDEQGNLRNDLPDNPVLYIAYGPEDMEWLDFEREETALKDESNLVTLMNPTDEALQELLNTGAFATAVVAGHGEEGAIYTTGPDGKAVKRSGEEFAQLFEGSSVSAMFLNACEGGMGADSVASSLNEVGMSVLTWAREVSDSDAIEAAGMMVRMTDLIARGATASELKEVADAYDGIGGNLISKLPELLREHGPDPDAVLRELQMRQQRHMARGGPGQRYML